MFSEGNTYVLNISHHSISPKFLNNFIPKHSCHIIDILYCSRYNYSYAIIIVTQLAL